MLERQFLLRSRATVDAGATLRLTGPHLPLNGATVRLEPGGVVELPALDETAARSRVLNRVESSGEIEIVQGTGRPLVLRLR